MHQTIQLSKEFKSGVRKSVASIILFVFVYIVITVLAVALTALFVYAGVMLIVAFPRFITLVIGAGLASLGILVLIFLLKFIFQSQKIDRSHLQEITEAEEPELFKMIKDIVTEVDTNFPKKVYWSSDVNASVFYDSSFWSMFLPVKKNLQIGLGLVNSVSAEELKAILAHEFGHFSQRTMKVGSYVYNVNHVIFNMLFNNDSYNKLAESWANVHSSLSIFVAIAVKVNQGIQWLLRIMYKIININYMTLSREMEFQADEIAAHITGAAPLKNSLLRLDLAQQAYDSVLNYYEGQLSNHIKSQNLYAEQKFVMDFLAGKSSVPVENGLPQVNLNEYTKFNKSKLSIKDQWASHPSMEDRVKRLDSLGISKAEKDNRLANEILKDAVQTQECFTERIFSAVSQHEQLICNSSENFKTDFENNYIRDTFNRVYNGYYDHKNPVCFDVGSIEKNASIRFQDLFSQEKLDLIYTSIALQSDIQTLGYIADKTYKIRTFDYDGKKYKQSESRDLLGKMKSELENINEQIRQNDILIYQYFSHLEKEPVQDCKLEDLYRDFFAYDEEYDAKYPIYAQLANEARFISETTPIEVIRQNLKKVKKTETSFKALLGDMIQDERFRTELSQETKDKLEQYISSDLNYFGLQVYHNDELEQLFTAMNEFFRLLSRGYFLTKKKLLDYQVDLLKNADT